MDVGIITTVISGSFAVLAVVVPSLMERQRRRAKAREQRQMALLKMALKDVQFLHAVEGRLLEMIHDMTGQNMKVRIRQEVTVDTGLVWSGRFTPGRIQQRLSQLDNN
ncbi:hypothetical protein [Aeromonas sp. Y311-2]|jgi:hypothetical protein|uniref:hypothetical protein n=1 Tax=Aeromonas sp. Y311-2 TaxID=2990507 RepID=UPI0022E64141|nr:hypothetical protein [Aeromonas sp. Y311-2]